MSRVASCSSTRATSSRKRCSPASYTRASAAVKASSTRSVVGERAPIDDVDADERCCEGLEQFCAQPGGSAPRMRQCTRQTAR
eukprot:6178430-Prymnesium_polylepis.1